MKRINVLVLLLVVLAMLPIVGGCVAEDAYYNESTGVIVTPDEYAAMTTAEQSMYEPVTVEGIDTETAGKIDMGLATTQGLITVAKPLIPEPFATGAVLVLGGLATRWQRLKVKKVKNTLDKVKLGAEITAASIDAVVRPATETWKAFKDTQKAAASHTDAIMPDKLSEGTT